MLWNKSALTFVIKNDATNKATATSMFLLAPRPGRSKNATKASNTSITIHTHNGVVVSNSAFNIRLINTTATKTAATVWQTTDLSDGPNSKAAINDTRAKTTESAINMFRSLINISITDLLAIGLLTLVCDRLVPLPYRPIGFLLRVYCYIRNVYFSTQVFISLVTQRVADVLRRLLISSVTSRRRPTGSFQYSLAT